MFLEGPRRALCPVLNFRPFPPLTAYTCNQFIINTPGGVSSHPDPLGAFSPLARPDPSGRIVPRLPAPGVSLAPAPGPVSPLARSVRGDPGPPGANMETPPRARTCSGVSLPVPSVPRAPGSSWRVLAPHDPGQRATRHPLARELARRVYRSSSMCRAVRRVRPRPAIIRQTAHDLRQQSDGPDDLCGIGRPHGDLCEVSHLSYRQAVTPSRSGECVRENPGCVA